MAYVDVCVWSLDDDDVGAYQTWETGCGRKLCISGLLTPCPVCGRRVIDGTGDHVLLERSRLNHKENMARASAERLVADEKSYPLELDEDGRPYFRFGPATSGNPRAARFPSDAYWHGHNGLALAWFKYADGHCRQDWRMVYDWTDDRDGHHTWGTGVEYATEIVFKRRNAAGEKSRGIA